MLRVRDLKKSYDGRVAVDGLSFDVARGETFGFLGPNGAGKSTTIHALTGLILPDSGGISLDGQDDPTLPDVRRRLGLAPQALSLYVELSAEENLAFFGALYGLSGARLRERINAVLDTAGLSDRRADLVGTFSGGMQRRLNLACALVHDPAILLLDEPTVGVDPQSRNHLFDTIERLAAEGRTILYTTHYMEEAERLCDRVAIVDHGKLLAVDTVDGLVRRFGGPASVEMDLSETPSDLSALPGSLDGGTLRFQSERPLEEIARLMSSGLKARSLQVREANLESVFLNLTGRSLRDA